MFICELDWGGGRLLVSRCILLCTCELTLARRHCAVAHPRLLHPPVRPPCAASTHAQENTGRSVKRVSNINKHNAAVQRPTRIAATTVAATTKITRLACDWIERNFSASGCADAGSCSPLPRDAELIDSGRATSMKCSAGNEGRGGLIGTTHYTTNCNGLAKHARSPHKHT